MANQKKKQRLDYRWDTPRDVSINIRLLNSAVVGVEGVVGDTEDLPMVALLALEDTDSESSSMSPLLFSDL